MNEPSTTGDENGSQAATLDSLPELLTVAQTGLVLGKTWHWVDEHLRSGDLPLEARRIGRARYISKTELRRWLDGDAA